MTELILPVLDLPCNRNEQLLKIVEEVTELEHAMDEVNFDEEMWDVLQATMGLILMSRPKSRITNSNMLHVAKLMGRERKPEGFEVVGYVTLTYND